MCDCVSVSVSVCVCVYVEHEVESKCTRVKEQCNVTEAMLTCGSLTGAVQVFSDD